MERSKFYFEFLIFGLIVHSIVSVPIPTNETAKSREAQFPSKYVEIKFPAKVATIEDLVNWIQNTMQTMASKIDINLATEQKANSKESKKTTKLRKLERSPKGSKAIKDIKKESPTSRNYLDLESPWLRHENEIYTPLLNAEAFLPLIVGDFGTKYPAPQLQQFIYNNQNKKPEATTARPRATQSEAVKNSNSSSVSSKNYHMKTQQLQSGAVPFSIPFEAFITITRENEVQKPNITMPEIRDPPDEYPPYFEKTMTPENATQKVQPLERGKKKENSRKRQIAVLGDLLRMLGVSRKTTKSKGQQSATNSAVVIKPPKINREDSRQVSIDDSPRARRNESTERQEFDEEANDDDYDDEDEGSLGSIADLLPLALPILEDLSNPETETNLIELIQGAIPLIAGLSDGDEDGNGGVQDLIATIVPIVAKIVGDGEGSDLGALVGPIFGLVAPFIGPIFAPVIGPLIRTISNPPSEGSSLPALINAVAGPLAQPQEPSGMSPLSIVIAGTTAALLRELKPGAPGGSDLGALIGAILSGVLAGTSAGLSGGSSGPQTQHVHAPYGANLQAPVSLNNLNRFPARPPPLGSPINSPFARPTGNRASTVNIGSTLRPPYSFSPRPPIEVHQPPRYQRPGPAPQVYHQQLYNHHQGLVPAAATNDQGGSSYLPYGGTAAVPANSVNPLALIGTTVKDILGAGIQVVSSLVNAVFGIIGASSQEEPKPSYGPPASGSYGQASG